MIRDRLGIEEGDGFLSNPAEWHLAVAGISAGVLAHVIGPVVLAWFLGYLAMSPIVAAAFMLADLPVPTIYEEPTEQGHYGAILSVLTYALIYGLS